MRGLGILLSLLLLVAAAGGCAVMPVSGPHKLGRLGGATRP